MTPVPTWESITQSMDNKSDYYKAIAEVLDQNLRVDIQIEKSLTGWKLSVVEAPSDTTVWNDYEKFYNAISWTDEQLTTWPDVTRTAFVDWEFKSLREAEKFKTLFTLQWPK